MGDLRVTILIAFYLFLGIRWDLVRRPMVYLIGAAGVCVILLSDFFGLGVSTRKVQAVFTIIGSLVAFGAGVVACLNMALPTISRPTAPPSETPEGE